jgi:hypothetical protein
MKKIFCIVVALAALSFSALAQTEKKTLMLGGSIAFQSSEGSSVFIANPNIGYFLGDNVAVGAELNLITSEGTTFWGVGPYLRGYFGKSTNGKFFLQAGFSFAGGEGDSNTAFSGKAGYALFLNKSIALEMAANILTQEGATLFGLGAGFQIHFKR